MEELTQPLQPPKVSQSTNAAALPKEGEEIEREAVLGRRRYDGIGQGLERGGVSWHLTYTR